MKLNKEHLSRLPFSELTAINEYCKKELDVFNYAIRFNGKKSDDYEFNMNEAKKLALIVSETTLLLNCYIKNLIINEI